MASKLGQKTFRRFYNGFGHGALTVLNLPPVNPSLERRFEWALTERMPPDIDPVDQRIVDGFSRRLWPNWHCRARTRCLRTPAPFSPIEAPLRAHRIGAPETRPLPR